MHKSTSTITVFFVGIVVVTFFALSCQSFSLLLPSSIQSSHPYLSKFQKQKQYKSNVSLNTVSSNEETNKETTVSSSSESDNDSDSGKGEILPFDPKYSTHGTIGEGTFIVTREGEPTEAELTNENLVKIVLEETNDLEVNTLVWKCLGYRFDIDTKTWSNEKCFPKWKEKHPTPPDLIGMQRIYTKEIDQPSLKSNQDLVRSVPVDWKQSLKENLKPYGFTGYKIKELTPNKTRRAQCTNWLLYYRMELFGYSIEELRERRRVRLEKIEEEERKRRETGLEDEWKPPVKEVF